MIENNYTGWRLWKPTPDEWAAFYENQNVPFKLHENEYLLVESEEGYTTYYCYENNKLRKFTGGSIKTFKDEKQEITDTSNEDNYRKNSKHKKEQKKYSKGKNIVITPRNNEQVCAFDLLRDGSKTVKLVLGVWGSGKDFIMANAALEQLRLGNYEKIIWIRNNVRLKDTPDLGALPGDVNEKLIGYVGPLVDAIGENSVKTMLTKGTLKIEPLQSLRGRNFENSIIICSEAENLTYDHLKLIVARVADGSCLYINGDIRQRDSLAFEKSQGLEKFIACLTDEKLFGYVYLPKTERSATAQLADKLDKFNC